MVLETGFPSASLYLLIDKKTQLFEFTSLAAFLHIIYLSLHGQNKSWKGIPHTNYYEAIFSRVHSANSESRQNYENCMLDGKETIKLNSEVSLQNSKKRIKSVIMRNLLKEVERLFFWTVITENNRSCLIYVFPILYIITYTRLH